jgi:hypothetical protein
MGQFNAVNSATYSAPIIVGEDRPRACHQSINRLRLLTLSFNFIIVAIICSATLEVILMRIRYLLMVLYCSVMFLLICPECIAAIYKYVDKGGMVYFADDLQSIPPQYRATAKIVSGEEKEESKGQTNQRQQSIQTETKKPEVFTGTVSEKPTIEKKEGSDSFGRRAMVSALVVVSALFAFVILRILDTDHRKPVAITRVVIIWGVSVFLLYAHAMDVVAVLSSIGSKIEYTQQQGEEKGKKAAKAVKALDALMEHAEKASSVVVPSDPDKDKKEEK